MFGVLVLSEGHDRIHWVSQYKLTLDNINQVLNMYANRRLTGDLDHAYDFLTNPERKNDHNLYIGNSESMLGTDEEYFFVREENLGGSDGLEETHYRNGNMFGSNN